MHFLGLLGEFRDSRIQTSRFESRILESTIIRFESHESNGKLSLYYRGLMDLTYILTYLHILWKNEFCHLNDFFKRLNKRQKLNVK